MIRVPERLRGLHPSLVVRRLRERLGPERVRLIRQAGKVGLIGCVCMLVFAGVGVEVSSQPAFCKTCHYMEPYYEAWKSSSHHDVHCTECHFPPDIQGKLQRKFAASVQVVKYVTRQYGMRPWTEIEDASCLRSGCHSQRLLAGKAEIPGSPGVVFDHAPHFASFRRVTRLRCTSCHSQIVQGQHMTVTLGTCFTCHFKGRTREEQSQQCLLCHSSGLDRQHEAKVAEGETESGSEGSSVVASLAPESSVGDGAESTPEPVSAYASGRPEWAGAKGGSGVSFDHDAVRKRGVNCMDCHSSVIRGTGFVSKENCWRCHAEPERIARFGDTEFMHAQHVTDHKIECQQCHELIEHGQPQAVEERVKAELVCSNCHADAHQETVQLYAGMGGGGAEGIPDAMFAARVSCEACHRGHKQVEGRSVADTPGAAGCMQCHGEEYGRVLSRWKEIAGGEVLTASDAHAAAVGELATCAAGEQASADAGKLLDKAVLDIRFVKHGGGVHNVRYAHRVLLEARDCINQAMAIVGSDYRMPELPDFEYHEAATAAEPKCRQCHDSAPEQPIPKYGVSFDHSKHTEKARVDCSRCHEVADMGAPNHGRMSLSPSGCSGCHRSGPMSNPHPGGWRASHGGAARSSGEACQVCHGSESCRTCHGVQMPHPDSWKQRHGAAAARRSDVCMRCHSENTCRNCHGLEIPHPAGWKLDHGAWAPQRGSTCARCHEVSQCQSCHDVSKPASHNAPDWKSRSGHGAAASSGSGRCSSCHDIAKGCVDCHGGIQMPHTSNWVSEHPAAVTQGAGVCMKCHDIQACNQCHADNRPESHRGADWPTSHGGTPEQDRGLCGACHGSEGLCERCHGGVSLPHADDWVSAEQHARAAESDPSACARCHPRSDASRGCMACHDGMPPSWHQTADFTTEHMIRDADAPLCELCHDAPACEACHAQRAPPS